MTAPCYLRTLVCGGGGPARRALGRIRAQGGHACADLPSAGGIACGGARHASQGSGGGPSRPTAGRGGGTTATFLW